MIAMALPKGSLEAQTLHLIKEADVEGVHETPIAKNSG